MPSIGSKPNPFFTLLCFVQLLSLMTEGLYSAAFHCIWEWKLEGVDVKNDFVALVIDSVLTAGLAKYTNLQRSDSNKSDISPRLLGKTSVQNIQSAASHHKSKETLLW